MSDKPPTLVAMYSWGTGEPVRVAEFRLNDQGRAELTLLDPVEGKLAQDFYAHGVDSVSEGRAVHPDDGPAFMRALLQPFRMSYYRFVDESMSSK
ncbi:hypothetical protein [Actinophytocola sp.]|uniref:hypothetical protein n=1 Tax=Actinophytocola sp. TaxID=1872138 RepID=UPI002D802106|nr:hypothetical protein [Actinophytocola sp.]HET9143309.1 hypothetical protein [Actinophytocola sp.]